MMKQALEMSQEEYDLAKEMETKRISDEEMPICQNCRWWSQNDGEQEANGMGECRRHAPRPTLRPEWDKNDMLVTPLAYFPITFGEWFCGDWKLNDFQPTTVPPAPRTA